MEPAELYQSLKLARPLAARLAMLSSLPVRVAPALLRLVRLRLLPQGSTGDEADLWLSDLVETRAAGAFAFRPAVRAYLRECLRDEAGLLDDVWQRVHLEHGRWIAPRARLEEELTWRLLRQRNDPLIESLWAGVVQELDAGPNAEGVARWVVRAAADLPEGTLDHPSGRRAFYGSHLLLGDATVLGREPQEFLTSGEFSFATRRLPRRPIFVGLTDGALIVSPARQIENGHALDVPATQPLWLQLEEGDDSLSPDRRTVVTIEDAEPMRVPTEADPITLRAIDGSAYEVGLLREAPRVIRRNRVPRVDITYDVELYGAKKTIQLPFVMGVMANLSGNPSDPLPPVEDRKFLEIDVDNFDSRMKAFKPRVAISVYNSMVDDGTDFKVELTFESLEDFSPAGVARNVAPLNRLLETAPPEPTLTAQLIEQLNLILHHEDFQRLEGTWRGLHYLVSNTETDEMLKIRVLNISKAELSKTVGRHIGISWDQSPIFKKVYEAEYGQFGGEPFGCLIGDYYFDQTAADVEVLGAISKIVAASHSPFIAGASPTLMHMQSWLELPNPRDLAQLFTTPEYVSWRSLRESDEARYLGLTMPMFLARMPYGAATNPVDEFEFEEDTREDPIRFTWTNAAYAMAVNINRSFKQYGWCARIRGIESGGIVEDLPAHTLRSPAGNVGLKRSTEVEISDRREAELADNGFMPLVQGKNATFAVFYDARSLQQPPQYDDPDDTAQAHLASHFPYLFGCCRFAHYLKCIVRDKIGSFRDRVEMEQWLQNWIAGYVNADPTHSSESDRARRPLATAHVRIEQSEDGGSYYVCKLDLQPHYQLEDLSRPILLVTRLPTVLSG